MGGECQSTVVYVFLTIICKQSNKVITSVSLQIISSLCLKRSSYTSPCANPKPLSVDQCTQVTIVVPVHCEGFCVFA